MAIQKTVYPDKTHDDPESMQAYARTERRRMIENQCGHFNRLLIKEQIVKINRPLAKLKREYRVGKSFSMTRVAAEVLPEHPINTARNYISMWNSGLRFPALTPAKIIILADVLQCQVGDLFEK